MRFFDLVLKFHTDAAKGSDLSHQQAAETDPRLTTQRILTLKELCELAALQIRSKGVGNTGTKASSEVERCVSARRRWVYFAPPRPFTSWPLRWQAR